MTSGYSKMGGSGGGRVGGGGGRLGLLLVFLSGALLALAAHLLLRGDLLDHLSPSKSEAGAALQSYLPDAGYLALLHEEEQVVQSFQSFSSKEIGRKAPSAVQTYKSCEPEAVKAVKAALRSKTAEKARRLYNHAINVCPDHPVVLVNYGEFLEREEEDVLRADTMFTRVVRVSPAGSPEHTRALQLRQRTAAMVEALDLRVLRRIDGKKERFRRISAENASALAAVSREAYAQHVFHTVGIEGNTLSLAQVRFVLETRMGIAGKSVAEHNEVIGLDEALKFVNDSLVDKAGDLTLEDVLKIHRRVLGHVDPFTAGAIRDTQVFVANHVPPPPSEVDLLVQKFMVWLNHPDRDSLHPVQLAALAHYKFVHIHPFADGNGRTSRLLMNVILMQSGFPPVIVRKQDRQEYFNRIVTANEGDVRPFMRFIAECTERTLDAFIAAAAAAHNSSYAGLMPFVDETETTITADDRADYHRAIIAGGAVGEDVVVVQP